MKSVSRTALGVALALGFVSTIAMQPAEAKKDKQADERQLSLTKQERAVLIPLQTAVQEKNWAAFAAALPAAQAGAQSANARYTLGRLHFDMGLATSNVPAQTQALDTMIGSGVAPATVLPQLYQNQAILAAQAGNRQKAETALTRWLELQPTNNDALLELIRIKGELRKPQEAAALLEGAIERQRAAGQAVPESWYKRGLALAFDGRMRPLSLKMSQALISAYPTPQNWRDSLLIYRDLSDKNLDKGAKLDLQRLMRAAKALNGERDWYDFAMDLDDNGLPGEAKTVLEEGGRLNMVDLKKPAFASLLAKTARRAESRAARNADKAKAMASATGTLALSTGDLFLGSGDYAEAAALYRAALAKGSVDANVANSRLGMALALAGNRAEAESAFRLVTGSRAELASYWLAWLARRA